MKLARKEEKLLTEQSLPQTVTFELVDDSNQKIAGATSHLCLDYSQLDMSKTCLGVTMFCSHGDVTRPGRTKWGRTNSLMQSKV